MEWALLVDDTTDPPTVSAVPGTGGDLVLGDIPSLIASQPSIMVAAVADAPAVREQALLLAAGISTSYTDITDAVTSVNADRVAAETAAAIAVLVTDPTNTYAHVVDLATAQATADAAQATATDAAADALAAQLAADGAAADAAAALTAASTANTNAATVTGKANSASPVFTGTVNLTGAAVVGLTGVGTLDVTGQAPVSQCCAGTVLRVKFTTVWPATRPTDRADVLILARAPVGTDPPTWLLDDDEYATY